MKTSRSLKTTRRILTGRIAVAAACAAALLASPSAHSAIYYWDSDGTVAGFGSTTGTWGTDAFYTLTATGGSPHSAVTTTTTLDTVNFGTATLNYGNATVGIAAGGVTATSIVFGLGQTTKITLGTAGGGAITLGGATRTIVANSSGHIINAPIILTGATTVSLNFAGGGTPANPVFTLGAMSGTGGLTLQNTAGGNPNPATFILNGASTYTGNTVLDSTNTNASVELRLGVNDALPTTTVLTIDGGAGSGSGRTISLNMNGHDQTLAGLVSVITGTLRTNRVFSASAAILTINGGGGSTYDGIIGSGGTAISLVKSGAGTQILTGSNTYVGTTKITGGILSLGDSLAIQSSALDTLNSITGDATNGLKTTVTTLTIGGLTGDKNFSTVFTTVSGGYTGLTALTLNPGVTRTYDANVGNGNGSMAFTKSGAGTQVFTVAQTYTGNTTISAGTLQLSTSGQLNSGTYAGNISIASGSTLKYSGTLDQTLSGVISGAGTILKDTGASTLTLSNANTFSTALTVASGTVKVGNAKSLGFGYTQQTTTAATTVSNGFTLDLNGTTGISEPIILNGTGIGANGALINSAGSGASIINGIAGITIGSATTGSAYSAAPTVTITGAGTGATATATLGVTAATIGTVTVTGTYTAPPTVAITGGGGTGATATVTNGGVITITNAGTGYTTAPTITFTGGTGGTSMTATANATQFTVGGVTLTAAGSGYTAPTYTFNSGNATPGSLSLSSVNMATSSSIGGTGDITISSVVSGTGAAALTKVGNNTLTLSGANTYTGLTTISAGTLALSGTGAINSSSGITISGSGAKFLQTSSVAGTPGITLTQGTLTGSGTVNSVNVGAGTGGIISNNNGVAGAALTIGSLTLAGAADLNLFSNSFSSTLAVTGTLTTAGTPATLTANNVGGWTNGTPYTLLTFGGGAIAGSGDNFTKVINNLVTRQSGTWNTTSSAITLTLAGDNPVWSGANGGTWITVVTNSPTSGTPNWALKNALTATDFWAGDLAEFNDTYDIGGGPLAPTTTTVDISAANVSPSSTTFNNTALNYTLNSSGGFGIATGNLTKNGTGNLTITTANTYTGGTLIQNGTIALTGGNDRLLTTGSVTLGDVATTGKLVLGDAAAASNQTLAGLLTTGLGGSVVGGNATMDSVLTLNIASANIFNGTLGGGGTNENKLAVTKSGAGNLTLGGNNTYDGATIINNGTLFITSNTALGSTVGSTTINGGNGTTGVTLSLTNSTSDLTIAENLNFFGNASGRAQLVNITAFNHTLTGAIDVSSATNLTQFNSGSTGSITVSGDITGTMSGGAQLFLRGISTNALNRVIGSVNLTGGDLAKTDAGTWLVGASGKTYSWANTLVAVGTLKMGLANILPSAGNLTMGNSTGGSTGTLDLNGFSQTTAGIIYAGAGVATGTRTITNSDGVNAAVFIINNATDNVSGNVAGANNIVFTGNLGLTKQGAGKLTLLGTNTYTGSTTVSSGTLAAGVASVANVSGAFGNNSAVTMADNATAILDITGFNTQIGSLTGGGTTGGNVTLGAATLTVGGDNTSPAAYAGSISGTGALTKIGSGTQILSGANTYSGITTVSAGTLSITNSLINAALGNIVVSAGGTLNVSGTITGSSTSTSMTFNGTGGVSTVNVSAGANISLFTLSNTSTSLVYNQTGGSVTLGTAGAATDNYVATTGYGYMNLTGGTYSVLSRLSVENGAGGQGVARVGGGAGTATLSVDNLFAVGRAATGTGELTVLPNGVVTYNGTAANNFLLLGNAITTTGFINVVGGSLQSATKAISFGNGTTTNGGLGIINLAAGTIEIGTSMITNTIASAGTNRGYVNFAGGTLKLLATGMTSVLPAVNAGGFGAGQANTIFGKVTNSTLDLAGAGAASGISGTIGTTQDFIGGVTIDTNGQASNTISVPLVAPSGGGVAQGNLSITGGSGYVAPPTVKFSLPAAVGSTPAAGYALVSGGQVVGIVITSPGSYASGDTVSVILLGGGGTGASVGDVSGAALTANTSGGLTKIGLGTLTLSGANTYTGVTNVNNGTLNLNGTLGTGSNVLNANATTNIGVSQTLAALNIGAGAVVTLTATVPFAPLAGEALSGPTSAVVPEPGSIGLLLVGSIGLLARRRRP